MTKWVLLAMHLTAVGDLADWEPPSVHTTTNECSERLLVVREEMIEAGMDRVLVCDPIASEDDIEIVRDFYWDYYVSPFR